MTQSWGDNKRYFALALDPIHVGTGGYRLGRVDMSIVREPSTNLPKIPGTSLSGVARAYTAIAQNRYRWEENGNKGSCAGKGGSEGDDHCGKRGCPVCMTYGFSKGKSKSSFQGLAQSSDARILFFPVHSMIGPVWITCPSVLREFKEDSAASVLPDDEQIHPLNANLKLPANRLNLGWLLLTSGDPKSITPTKWEGFKDLPGLPNEISQILDRALQVSDKVFSRVVNDNLEVRTSVAIDPATGAAEDGALYSYEAIPRATVLWFDVVFNKPEHFSVNGSRPYSDTATWQNVRESVESGLEIMPSLGVGGMGTRGMGRLRILNLEERKQTSPAEQTGKAPSTSPIRGAS